MHSVGSEVLGRGWGRFREAGRWRRLVRESGQTAPLMWMLPR